MIININFRMYPAEYRVGNESHISKSCRSKDDSLFCRRDDYDSSGTFLKEIVDVI